MKYYTKISTIMISFVIALVAFGVNPDLILAIKLGHVDVAKRLLSQESDINGKIAGVYPLKAAVLAVANNAELVRLVVDKGADVNMKDDDGMHILIPAIVQQNMDVIKLLIDKGADVNAKDKDGNPAFIYMAVTNNIEGAKLLISKNAEVPLVGAGYIAAEACSVEFVDFLMGRGLKVNHADEDGDTLLHQTVYGNFGKSPHEMSRMVEFLLSKGADVNAKNKKGLTPLHIAASGDRSDLVKLLLAKGADANAKDKDGLTPLELAKKEKSVLTVMIMGGEVDEKYKDENGNTLLHIATKLNMPEQAVKLLEKGASANAKNKEGMTPLHIAAARNNVKVAEFLLAKGARQLKDEKGCNPLHIAAQYNSAAVAELLLKKGAKPNVKDKNDCTPLVYAVEKNYVEVAKVLVDHGADVNVVAHMSENQDDGTDKNSKKISGALIECALLKKHFDIAKLLINAKGAKINLTFKEWGENLSYSEAMEGTEFKSYLAKAAEANSSDVVSALLPKLNDTSIFADAGKALCAAARNGNVDMCRLLLDKLNGMKDIDKKDTASGKKADIDELPILGVAMRRPIQLPTFPLHEAVIGGNTDCVKLLLDQGADVNRQRIYWKVRGDGNTPLHCAVEAKDAKNAVALVKLLMDKGAKAGITNSNGKKAVDLTKNDEIIEMLDGEE